MITHSKDGVRLERTGWRDQSISQRHREWGFNCPAVDLDFLVVEYNLGKPVGLIEYKHHNAKNPDTTHPTYRALCTLADISGLPFVIAFYWSDVWAFRVMPVNQEATKHFKNNELMSEFDYVSRLYRMRRLLLTKHLEAILHRELPMTEHDTVPF